MINNSNKSCWYNDGQIEKLIKPGQNIPENFKIGRLSRPKKIDILRNLVCKEDLIQYYIIDNNSYTDTMLHFNLSSRKDLRKLLDEYGISKNHKQSAKYAVRTRTHESYVLGGKKSADTQKRNWSNKSDDEKQAYSDMQKTAHSTEHFKNVISKINIDYNKNLDNETKEKRNKKRSESCKKAYLDGSLYKKQHEIKKINYRNNRPNRVCRTVDEQKIYDVLIQKYNDLKYDSLIDDRYPYYVDFYIPEEDLFIEYQGYPAHGNYPYIENDKKSLEESIRLYGQWREIYLKLDVEKYNCALKSKINFIRIYPNSSLEENYSFNDNKFTKLIKLIYDSVQ